MDSGCSDSGVITMKAKRTVEPTWPKLVEPVEKMMDRLTVVWVAVNHLKVVKDTPELRSTIEEIQPEKVEFDIKPGQSKPIYNAFKAIRESPDWDVLSDAPKRIVELHRVVVVRLANNTYTLDKKSFYEYETHFTLMWESPRVGHYIMKSNTDQVYSISSNGSDVAVLFG
ncbi:hypothetical protein M8C21_030958 [Ambrosia artemisiifolia]|uniref:Oligopeptidase A N-terminal domain-containing protein n=1 Tax=Ambrosia artemisiifolia TaxID=4212 RepID=A0AAD5CB78_AMBAR|nr:hypothetical protein M8C21_030958 [Ambrosia artemisiifolia]